MTFPLRGRLAPHDQGKEAPIKTLLSTADVFALVLSAAACDTAETSQLAEYESSGIVADTAGTLAEGSSNDAALVPAEDARQTFTLASGEVEASDLIGASVHDANGEEIATVADVWLADAGSVPKRVLRDDGMAGLGGDLHAVDFQTAAIVADADTAGDEPNAIVNYAGDTLKTLPKGGALFFWGASDLQRSRTGANAVDWRHVPARPHS